MKRSTYGLDGKAVAEGRGGHLAVAGNSAFTALGGNILLLSGNVGLLVGHDVYSFVRAQKAGRGGSVAGGAARRVVAWMVLNLICLASAQAFFSLVFLCASWASFFPQTANSYFPAKILSTILR